MTERSTAPSDRDELAAMIEPVRRALLDDAATEADRIVADARRDAESMVEEAEAEVRTEIRRAEERAERSARARADRALARTRNDTHRDILRAKHDIHRRLVEAARAAALSLQDDPRYPRLLEAIEQLARDRLGPDVEIERDPAGRGGIIGTAGSHSVDYTLPTLADRALGSLADDMAELWR